MFIYINELCKLYIKLYILYIKYILNYILQILYLLSFRLITGSNYRFWRDWFNVNKALLYNLQNINYRL